MHRPVTCIILVVQFSQGSAPSKHTNHSVRLLRDADRASIVIPLRARSVWAPQACPAVILLGFGATALEATAE